MLNVLFLCTGNSARSILAESILARDGFGRFRAFSAGSQPKQAVNPFAIETLRRNGYPTAGLRSKSWDEFDAAGADRIDLVITVCDNAAGEACPIWPGHPVQAHWGIDDPAAVEGTPDEKLAAFSAAFGYLRDRVARLIALPLEELDTAAVAAKLREIGHGEGASAGVRRSD